jgi:hypothetical protein
VRLLLSKLLLQTPHVNSGVDLSTDAGAALSMLHATPGSVVAILWDFDALSADVRNVVFAIQVLQVANSC